MKKRPDRAKQRQRFEKLLENVAQGYLWGREVDDAVVMAFSSGVLMGALTMIHVDWAGDRLAAKHKMMLDDLNQRFDEFKARGGVSFIVPFFDEEEK